MQTEMNSSDADYYHNSSLREEAMYLSARSCSTMKHRGTGWIWDNGLKTRMFVEDPDNDMDESCHYGLFGEAAYNAKFRGWFNKGILCIQSRNQELKSLDDIPQRLFQHLMNEFHPEIGKVRLV